MSVVRVGLRCPNEGKHTPTSHCLISERRGPEFLVEPQSSIVFLNDTGAIVTCSAKGTPAPSITWTKVDGTSLSSVAGLRQIRKDLLTSQLVYLPFSAANYRQDVHSGTIRCVAANAAGAIQSQDVHIRAIFFFLFSSLLDQLLLSCTFFSSFITLSDSSFSFRSDSSVGAPQGDNPIATSW
ncbi:hypothetical protein TYRP_019172 [Tyrophagus putrescentiae]|nr:hypothetical protein TYRP_019172 [Tyrophagus putrescentiae]